MSFDSNISYKKSILSSIEVDICSRETDYSNKSFACDDGCTCKKKTCFLTRYATLNEFATKAYEAYNDGRFEEIPTIVKDATDQIKMYESE